MIRMLRNLTLLLAFAVAPFSVAGANEEITIDKIVYTVNPDTGEAQVSNCKSTNAKIVIPESIDYNGNACTVTSVGRNAFWTSNATLEAITLPPTVKLIDDRAFNSCRKLTEFDFPKSLTEIGQSAFAICTGLENLALPDGLVTLGAYAFAGCTNLKTISLPASFRTMEDFVFSNCPNLEEVNIDSANETFASVDGAIYDKAVTELIFWPQGVIAVKFPSTVKGIRRLAFYGNQKLIEIDIPATIEVIGRQAFENCYNLQTVHGFENIKSFGAGVFRYCKALREITIPDMGHINVNQLRCIPTETFRECTSLEHVAFTGTNLYLIDSSAFKGCTALKEISLPEGLTDLCSSAFKDCAGLENMELPSSLTWIRSGVFEGCTQLKTIISHRATPPSITNSDPFSPETYSTATLLVPEGAIGAYSEADYWKNFIHMEVGAIDAVELDSADSGMVEVVAIDGRVVYTGEYASLKDAPLANGSIYIVRNMTTGKVEKMLR